MHKGWSCCFSLRVDCIYCFELFFLYSFSSVYVHFLNLLFCMMPTFHGAFTQSHRRCCFGRCFLCTFRTWSVCLKWRGISFCFHRKYNLVDKVYGLTILKSKYPDIKMEQKVYDYGFISAWFLAVEWKLTNTEMVQHILILAWIMLETLHYSAF